jgi:hypothetical protein
MRIDDEAEREGGAILRQFRMPRIAEPKKSRRIIKQPTKQDTASLFEPTIPEQLNDSLSDELQKYLYVIGRPIRRFRTTLGN